MHTYKIYCLGMIATRIEDVGDTTQNVRIFQSTDIVATTSEDEALENGFKAVREQFPESEGFSNHSVVLKDVSNKFLTEMFQLDKMGFIDPVTKAAVSFVSTLIQHPDAPGVKLEDADKDDTVN